MSALIWDEGNREHATRHGVSMQEIEEVFRRPFAEVVLDIEEWDTEVQIRALGTTASGRYITITFTERGGHPRPITAWPMTEEELRIYAQHQQVHPDQTEEPEV